MPSFYSSKESRAFLLGAIIIAAITASFLLRNIDWHKDEVSQSKEVFTESALSFLDPSQLIQALRQEKEHFLLLDVRSEEHYQTEHIVGSKNMPLEVMSSLPLPADTAERTLIIIFSAQEEKRGLQAARFLSEKKDLKVAVLRGGIEAWKQQGGQTLSWGNPDSFIDQSKISFITPEELQNALATQRSFTILDTRTPELFMEEHIAGALNIPLASLEERHQELSTGKTIVLYGSSALDNFQAGVRLFDLNYFGAKILEGGLTAWKEKGFPTKKTR
jgi:rhodanese-related sulfurtransferase